MIRAAIVGLGVWGRHLVDSVDGSEAIRFVAGTTRTLDRARDFAGRHGLSLHATYDDLLADRSVDAVVLATPHSQHVDQVVTAARAGKHVFTEKPFALTVEGARAAVDACLGHGVTLAVGYNWRFQPALREIRAMVDDGRLGRVLHLEGNFCGPGVYRLGRDHWRQRPDEGPGGGMTGRGVHLVDAMLLLAGRVRSVHAQSLRLARDEGMDDTTSMLLRFHGGATGYLGTVIATAETWRLQVFGSRGWVEVGGVEHLPTWDLRVGPVDPADPWVNRPPETVTFAPTSTERAELEHFARAALERRPLAVPDGDEVHGVAVLEAVLRSIGEGGPTAVEP